MFTRAPRRCGPRRSRPVTSPRDRPAPRRRGNPRAPRPPGSGAAASNWAGAPAASVPVVQIARLPGFVAFRHPLYWLDGPRGLPHPAGRRRPDRAIAGGRLFPDGYRPSGGFRGDPPTEARRAGPPGLPPGSGRTRIRHNARVACAAPPDAPACGFGARPAQHHLACNHGHGAGFVRPRAVRFDRHPTLPVAAVEDVVLHAMSCLAPPASAAVATSAMRLHGVPLELLEGPAHGRPVRPSPQGTAPAGPARRVHRGGRRPVLVPRPRDWLRSLRCICPGIGRVDFLIEGIPRSVEIDGFAFHSSREAMRRDLGRTTTASTRDEASPCSGTCPNTSGSNRNASWPRSGRCWTPAAARTLTLLPSYSGPLPRRRRISGVRPHPTGSHGASNRAGARPRPKPARET